METYLYSLTAQRKLTAGNYVTYAQPTLHPDRIIQEHDFVFLLEGAWEIWLDNTAYSMKPGDVLMLPAGIHHFGKKRCTPGTKTMYLHLSIDEKNNCVAFPPLISCSHVPEIRKLFSHIISRSHRRKTAADEHEITALLNYLICRLYQVSVDKNAGHNSLVNRAVELMTSSPEYFYSLKELTDELNISAKTLNRKFYETYNRTAYQYQMDLKLEAVYSFLQQHPTEKLKTAAINYGFYDEFYLSKLFKKKYGISPSEIRCKKTEVT